MKRYTKTGNKKDEGATEVMNYSSFVLERVQTSEAALEPWGESFLGVCVQVWLYMLLMQLFMQINEKWLSIVLLCAKLL